jgi:putative endonuclease
MAAYLYILRCSDGSYYVGTTRTSLEFAIIADAIAAERQIKNWGRAKKEALIRSDYEALKTLSWGWSKNKAVRPSTVDRS